MATTNLFPFSKQFPNRAFAPGTRRKYVAAGVTPQRFNAWGKKTPAQKRAEAAKAKAAGFSGSARERFLGLRPHQISGADPMTGAVAAFRAALGDRPKYNPAGVRRYLADLRENEGSERIREIAKQSPNEVLENLYPKVSAELAYHYH
ncbi:MAG: hypothetical protein ABL897_05800 [Hyphomicrobium sp.]